MTILSKLKTKLDKTTAVTTFFDDLDQNQIVSLDGELYAHFYWLRRNPSWKKETNETLAKLKRIKKRISKRISLGRFKPELSEFGSEIVREHTCLEAQRYEQLYLRDSGWEVMHALSWYHQYWLNQSTKQITCFCEGDITLITASTQVMLFNEIHSINHWIREEA